MKIASKILILVLTVSLAILAIMAIVKTRVEPPVAIEQVDQYSEDISSLIDKFKEEDNQVEQYEIFRNICNRLSVFSQEHKIGKKEYDKMIKDVIDIYAPKFIAQSYERFAKTVWNADDHVRILEVSAYLKSLKLSTGKMALNKDSYNSLLSIERIIADYRTAWAIARSTSFQGLDRARSNINKAREYINNPYLKNCTALTEALGKVRSNLHNSHWNYLNALVEKLRNYGDKSNSAFIELVQHVDEQLIQYDNNAYSVYGTKNENYSSLRSRARSYVR